MLRTVSLLGVKITNDTEENVLEYVLSRLKTSSKRFFITTPNPEILVYANSHLDYKDKLNDAEVALPDGIGLIWAAKLLGRPIRQRIAGVDFIEKLCEKSKEKPVSMGFLGGRGGVAEEAVNRLRQKYPWIKVAWVGEEWGKGKNDAFGYSSGNQGQIDILFVAFGAPKQEEWIYENLDKLPVKAAMGVGGAFDYLSGRVIRAPKFVRSLGLEWLFRLFRQPWRIRRQLALIKFVFLVFKEKK